MSEYSSQAVSQSYNDSSGGLFEPDVVLPSQFLERKDRGLDGGERKLMAALLSDGIEAYIQQAMCGEITARFETPGEKRTDAREWVNTRDYGYIFSFDVVCECLGIDPEYLRLGLGRYVASIAAAKEAGKAPEQVWKRIRRPRKQ